MTAAVFEARSCPTWLNEIKKTKLDTYTSPAAGINFLLGAGRFAESLNFTCHLSFTSKLKLVQLLELSADDLNLCQDIIYLLVNCFLVQPSGGGSMPHETGLSK